MILLTSWPPAQRPLADTKPTLRVPERKVRKGSLCALRLSRAERPLFPFECRKRSGCLRPDYVTPDHHRAYDRTFAFAPIAAAQPSPNASRTPTSRPQRFQAVERRRGSTPIQLTRHGCHSQPASQTTCRLAPTSSNPRPKPPEAEAHRPTELRMDATRTSGISTPARRD